MKSKRNPLWRHGINILTVEIEFPYTQDVHVTEDAITVDLSDGLTISVALGWFTRLEKANAEERRNWWLIGKGHGIQ